MLANYAKRTFSVLLALLMVVSMVPVQAFATETDEHDHGDDEVLVQQQSEEGSETPAAPVTEDGPQEQAEEENEEEPQESEPEETEPEETEPEETETQASGESQELIDLRAEGAQYIEKLGLRPDMTDEELLDVYLGLSSWDQSKARNDAERIRYYGTLLSKEEQAILLSEENTQLGLRFYDIIQSTRGPMMFATAENAIYSGSPVEGVQVEVSRSSGSGNFKTDDGTVPGSITVTVNGYLDTSGCNDKNATTTVQVYFKNTSGKKGTLTFKWANNGLTVGTELTAEQHSFVLEADDPVDFTLTSPEGTSGSGTFTMSEFAFVEMADSFEITLDETIEAESITVGDEAYSAGDVVEVPQAGATVTLTPVAGKKFVALVDEDGLILSRTPSFQLIPEREMTIRAIYEGTTTLFLVDDTYIVEGLNEAMDKGSLAVLLNDSTLPAGDYTIPAGKTLLIPFDAANTLCTTQPQYSNGESTPSAYRTLTMDTGANLLVEGAMSISGTQVAGGNNAGIPKGPLGFVKMASDSNITVANGGKLYVWGYITGSGSVTIKNGGTVYEDFQVTCWRGGTNITSMLKNQYRVFPMSQYYIQNVEVPMTLEAGAVENGFMSAYVSRMTIGSAVPFIGPDGMFEVTSGSITKDFNEATDRLEIDINGTVEMQSLKISMSMVGTMDSSSFELPVNSNITVRVNSGSSVRVTQNLAMLPGAEMYVRDGANVSLGSGVSVYFYDASEWVGKGFAHQSADVKPLGYAPGRTGAKHTANTDAYVYVEGTLDASKGYVYTTASGANITAGEGAKVLLKPGTQTATYQVTQTGSDGKTLTYIAVPITPAKLKNAAGKDPAYTETSALAYAQYTYTDGVWVAECLHGKYVAIGEAKDPTCTTPGLSAGEKCADCGYVKSEQTEISALDHDEIAHDAKAPTCTEIGWDAYVTCSRCDYTTYVEKDALDHDKIAHEAKAPTCTEIGWDAYVTCSRCDYTTYVEKDALDHDEIAHEAKAPTCTETGWDAYVTCSRCDYTTYEEKDALDHDEIAHEAKDPDCVNVGWDAYVTCSRCDYTTYVEKDALDHDEIAHEAKDPDCVNVGWDAYVTCSRCDYTTYVEKDALDHTPGDEATCTADQICTVCKAVLTPALGHDEIQDVAIPATCTKPGEHAGSHCSRCDYTTGGGKIDALSHDHKGVQTTDPTCTDKGVMTYTCSRNCGEEGAVYTVAIPAQGHDEIAHEAKAPTCTEIGWDAYVTCSRCDYTTYVEKDALDHDEIAHEAKAPTCTETGWDAYVTCSRCDYTTYVEKDALDHDEIAHEAKDPTCTEIGWDAYVTCSRCDYTTYVEKDALDHDEIQHEAQAVTCEEIGWDAYVTCSRCDYTTYEEIEAKGHGALVDEELIPALCDEDGHEPGKKCVDCGVYVEGGAVLPSTGHKLYQYEAKIPTYTLPGWEAYERCSQCAYTTYVEIPRVETPHITSYESFIQNLAILEQAAQTYALEHPGTDPLNLVIKYIRTGVERYNSGSWNIMAGYEDAGFRKFADEQEDLYNQKLPKEQWVAMSSLKYIDEFTLPNGDVVDFGHMFGTMDITYHNNCGVDHADVGGWSGDLVDLLTTSSGYIGENYSSDLETTVKFIKDNYLFKMVHVDDKFSATDWYGDADGFYMMQNLAKGEYKSGDMVALMQSYFTGSLDDHFRADYLIRNRFGGVSTRQDLRTAVYNAYTGNKTIATLEATRDFTHSGEELALLRKAVCYAFADYLCQTAGDYVDVIENPYYTVFDSKSAELAPGITQQLNLATSADGKQMAYYIATADLRSSNVHVYANYASRDPQKWAMARVLDQANNMQALYGDPDSSEYIENFNVIASINAGGYDMSDGDPGGLLIMHGQMYKPVGSGGFFAITKEGKAILGATSEWDRYADQVEEAIGGFGTLLVKDGKIAITATSNYYNDRAPRSAVGITATGKVVFMVLDGRQEPFSCGGSMIEIAQIMFEAGCVDAINLDGGGSSTFVARQPGDEGLSVMNRPSDGAPRSVSTSLVMASTAPSSTAFDHAELVSATKFVTKGTSLQITAEGISATGNAAELPEGLTWLIDSSSANWASIDENGLFVAKDRTGAVEVKLMLGDHIVGRTTITIVEPTQLYFTKTTLSAVYGQTIQLPVKALYQGKEVTVRTEDIVFTMAPDAGVISGFEFTASESNIKNVKITAALASNAEVAATVTVNLFKQGENSFDFDQATSGDRMLAWLRTVTNATTDDDVTYTVVDPDKDMVTSYVLAMDMSQIPVPEILDDLIYMLPGADMEDASAWGFLMQLAERVSPMTTVTPKIVFDSRVDVDISEMKLLNDYFVITDQKFDEATNTLTLTLNWIDQTAAIDPATANPLCMVTGIKVTPKADADWGAKDTLNIAHSGDISYKIYLRASGLYSFAQKPENQQTFGLYAYVNPNDSADKGGYFTSTYAQFEDSYTLVNVAKEGWVNETGGFAYYVDGQKLIGVHKIDGLYYGFDENGINVGMNPYSGLFQEKGTTYYAINGEIQKGWHSIDNTWYFFDWSTGVGRNGAYTTTFSGVKVTYQLENGKMVKGFWYEDGIGRQYYEGPNHVRQGWRTIDGKQYLFRDYYAYTGICPTYQSHDVTPTWYEFEEDGALIGMVEDGLYWYEGDLYYVTDGQSNRKGVYIVDGDYYHFGNKGIATRDQTLWISTTNGLLTAGTYRMGSDGKLIMTTELVNENGTLYFYQDGLRTGNAGMQLIDGSYYHIGSGAIAATNQSVWVSKTNGHFTAGTFRFGADGKLIMTTEIVDEDGILYYYKDGRRTASAGLVQFQGDYYHIDGGAKAERDVTIWVSKTNGFFPAGSYYFGTDGKMVIYNGIVNGYYYVDGIKTAAGLIQVDGDYYYAEGGGKLVTNKSYWITKSNDMLTVGTYRFDAEGKIIMTTELVNENGTLYYYKNGLRTGNAGMLLIDGSYYYIGSGAIAATSQSVWVSNTNGHFTAGTFRFGADAKLIMTTEVVDENGTLYYYKNGRRTASAGLVKFNGDYYHIDGGAKAQRDVTIWVSNTNGFFPAATYTFGSDGKMVIYDGIANGYYYVDGVKTAAGLIMVDGNYYYAEGAGKLVTNKSYWITKGNGMLTVGTYRFDAEGKIIMTTELVNENGTLYYYKDGLRTGNAGMQLIDGSYYYIGSGAKAAVSQSVWVSNTNGHFTAGTFRFGADAKLILTTEIVDENGTLYYYKDGRRTASAGLVKFNGDYYHIDGGAKAQRDVTIWVSNTNGFFPAGSYYFGADGKMAIYNGIVNGYYYVDGIKTSAGLIQVDGNYYFAEGGGKLITNKSYWVSRTNDLLTAGTYRFDAEGKIIMTTELVDEGGTLYYYKDGLRTGNAGLIQIDGSYYYIASGAKPVVNQRYWCSKTNGLMAVGSYTFGTDGKMILN